MRDIALPGGIGLRIERGQIFEPHDLARVELERIAQQPVERRRGDIDIALLGRRLRRGPRIGVCGCGLGKRARQFDGIIFSMRRGQIAQQRLHAQQKTRRDRGSAFVARGAAENDFGRAERSRQIVRRKPDAEIGSRDAKRAQHRRREQSIDRAARRPGAFG